MFAAPAVSNYTYIFVIQNSFEVSLKLSTLQMAMFYFRACSEIYYCYGFVQYIYNV